MDSDSIKILELMLAHGLPVAVLVKLTSPHDKIFVSIGTLVMTKTKKQTIKIAYHDNDYVIVLLNNIHSDRLSCMCLVFLSKLCVCMLLLKRNILFYIYMNRD